MLVDPSVTLLSNDTGPNVCVNAVVQVNVPVDDIGKLIPLALLRINVPTDIALVPPVSVIEPPVCVYVPEAAKPNPFNANVPPLCVTLKTVE